MSIQLNVNMPPENSVIAEAAIEGVQASVDALKLLSGDYCLKIEIVIIFGNI